MTGCSAWTWWCTWLAGLWLWKPTGPRTTRPHTHHTCWAIRCVMHTCAYWLPTHAHTGCPHVHIRLPNHRASVSWEHVGQLQMAIGCTLMLAGPRAQLAQTCLAYTDHAACQFSMLFCLACRPWGPASSKLPSPAHIHLQPAHSVFTSA